MTTNDERCYHLVSQSHRNPNSLHKYVTRNALFTIFVKNFLSHHYSNRVLSLTHIAQLDMIVQIQNKRGLVYIVVENSTQIYLYLYNVYVWLPQDISCGLFYFSLKAVIIIIRIPTIILFVYIQYASNHTFKLRYLFVFFNSMTVSNCTQLKNLNFINLDRLDNQ